MKIKYLFLEKTDGVLAKVKRLIIPLSDKYFIMLLLLGTLSLARTHWDSVGVGLVIANFEKFWVVYK